MSVNINFSPKKNVFIKLIQGNMRSKILILIRIFYMVFIAATRQSAVSDPVSIKVKK